MFDLLNALHELNSLTEQLLTEDIDAVRKYYPNIDDETFNIILHTDPTYREGSNSVGKYTKWLLNLAKKDISQLPLNNIANMDILKDDLQKFDKLKSTLPSSDIGQFKTIEDFWEVVDKLSEDDLTDRQKERRLRKSYSEADKVFENNKWQIWIPKTYAASCTLGKGTRWCTATSKTDSYYNQYTSQGPLYIIINKTTDDDAWTQEKYQLHFESNQFMDINDDPDSVLATFDTGHTEDEEVLAFLDTIAESAIKPKMKMSLTDDGQPYIKISNNDYAECFDYYYRDKRDNISGEYILSVIKQDAFDLPWDISMQEYADFIDALFNYNYIDDVMKALDGITDKDELKKILLHEVAQSDKTDDIFYEVYDTFKAYYDNNIVGQMTEYIIDKLNDAINSNVKFAVKRKAANYDFNNILINTDKLGYKESDYPYIKLWAGVQDDIDYNEDVQEISDNPIINNFLYLMFYDLDIREPYYGFDMNFSVGEFADFTQDLIDILRYYY